MTKEKTQNVIIYIDGFNFYFGLKSKGWKKYYWLDIVGFFSKFIKSNQNLIEVNYFSARPTNTDKRDRQDKFFQANLTNPKFNIFLGKYLKKDIKCRQCNNVIHTFEEKETDVRISTKMIEDAYSKRCDVSILVSADSDLIPPIELIKKIKPDHRIYVYFPPLRHSRSLSSICHGTKNLDGAGSYFASSLLPEKIILSSGFAISCPTKWK